MSLAILSDKSFKTPAYIYDETSISSVLERFDEINSGKNFQLLYSIKAVSTAALLERIAPHVAGFSCSSLFECMLAKEILNQGQHVHITTPGMSTDNIAAIATNCDFISFNSLQQFLGLSPKVNEKVSCGIRINPELSFVEDPRYDPCCDHSKLGVPVNVLKQSLQTHHSGFTRLEGLHVHNNCESNDFNDLKNTIDKLDELISHSLPRLKWLNLGGGYYLDHDNQSLLIELMTDLTSRYGLQLLFEPGKGIVGKAGYLASRVIDLFESNGRQVAVLDTTINHLPEVFEYQYQPTLQESNESGSFTYRIVGCSCLSGDLFGDYQFDQELEIGSKLTFENIGAYMLVKANMFNGINLPAVYLFNKRKQLELLKEFDYKSFRSRM